MRHPRFRPGDGPPRGRLAAAAVGLVAVLALGLAPPAAAQLEDNLSSYTDDSAEGYLLPLVEAFGQNLNAGFFTSANIPKSGFRARLEVHAMSVFFGDDDRTFQATTGGDFSPETTVEAPTVVGSGESVTATGAGGTEFVFPGGFDLGSFTLAVPQLTFGSVMGTEAAVRWIAVESGDGEVGDLSLLGFGLRHSVSQYLTAPPVDLAVSLFYQTLTAGEDDLLDATALSFGVQASKPVGMLEPFASITLDSFDLTAKYTVNEGEEDEESIELDVENDMKLHGLLGVGLHLGFIHLHVAGNLSDRPGISGGLAIGF